MTVSLTLETLRELHGSDEWLIKTSAGERPLHDWLADAIARRPLHLVELTSDGPGAATMTECFGTPVAPPAGATGHFIGRGRWPLRYVGAQAIEDWRAANK